MDNVVVVRCHLAAPHTHTFSIVLERWGGGHVYGCKRLGHMEYNMNGLVQHT